MIQIRVTDRNLYLGSSFVIEGAVAACTEITGHTCRLIPSRGAYYSSNEGYMVIVGPG